MPLPAYPRSTFVASKDPERIYSYLDVPASSSSSSTSAPPILFLHGFPDLAIGWSEQIEYFSSRGHRCIAPDMLGYGLTSRPSREEGRLGEYAIMSMSEDIARLVQHALSSSTSDSGSSSTGKVIVISHDHGANFAWKFTHYHPHLVLGMVGLCVPYARITSRWASREVITQLIPTFGYQIFFEEPKSTIIIQDQVSEQAKGRGPPRSEIEQAQAVRRRLLTSFAVSDRTVGDVPSQHLQQSRPLHPRPKPRTHRSRVARI